MDKANEEDIVVSITKNSEFRGPNLWTLIFAIFIASIGLNVNSTAVIIGAMLISPLMGPIMGIGLGIGTNNFGLVKKGSRNLAIATVISILTSTLYFWVTPLHDAQSELLARTTPSLWDVFIAFLGGLAGIVASTRKEKSNAIPGVAIATALMPPLCTAGFGLASGNWMFFLGALYLFFINSVFICISTFLIVRVLNFGKAEFEDKSYGRKVSRYMLIIVLVTALPSVYLAYRIVQKSIFENNAQRFIREQFNYRNTQVVSKTLVFADTNKIDLLLIGYELPAATIDSIRKRLPDYKLPKTVLDIRQGLNAKQEIDFSQIKTSILEDVFKHDSLSRNNLDDRADQNKDFPDLRGELKALYPDINYYTANDVLVQRMNAEGKDTITLVVAGFSKPIRQAERLKLKGWLKSRLAADSLKLIID